MQGCGAVAEVVVDAVVFLPVQGVGGVAFPGWVDHAVDEALADDWGQSMMETNL